MSATHPTPHATSSACRPYVAAPLTPDEIASLPGDPFERDQAIACLLNTRYSDVRFEGVHLPLTDVVVTLIWTRVPSTRVVRRVLAPLNARWLSRHWLPAADYAAAAEQVLGPLGLVTMQSWVAGTHGYCRPLEEIHPDHFHLPYGGEPLVDVLDAAAQGLPVGTPTLAEAVVWLASRHTDIRLAGLRLLAQVGA